MKKNIFDKSLFAIRMLVVVLCVICGAVPAWAGHDTHYARVTVTASGEGKVYMTTDKAYAPGNDDWKDSMSEDWNCNDGVNNETDSRTYYAHAQANSGYHFAKWSSNSGGSDSKSTDNPYAYSTSASSTSSGSPTANNIYAIFAENLTYKATFLTTENGSYTYQYGSAEVVTVTTEQSVETNLNFALTATPDAGYELYGWYTESGGVKTYFDYSSYSLPSYALPGNVRIGVDFMPIGTPLFQIKGESAVYTDLNAAVTACGAATKTIVLVNNGTLPARSYTIPANVTLLIPFDANYTCYTETPGTIDSYTSPAAYRTLTMSPGARLIVNGKISLSAKVSGLEVQGPNGAASGLYGAIKMLSEGNTKSTITLNNGGKLYCWGYIYGEGEVEALSGSTVHEGFNFMDFRGAQNTNNMIGESHKVFPFNQYYIQNIEVPLTIHYGATEQVFSCLYPGGYEVPIPITMVGSSDGLFRLTASGAKLTKWYDPHDDRQHYAFEGNAAIRNIEFDISLMGVSKHVNSANFVLPISNNMDIEVRNGATVDIAENVCIMPDASITVEEGATLNITSDKSVYVYDLNAYTNAGTYSTSRGGYPENGPGRYALGAYIRRVNYSPSWATVPDREIRRLAILHTARFKINGTLNATGKIYTTEGGADIYSDTDGAVINLSTAAGTANVTYQVDHQSYDAYYYSIPITSAQLHNADQSYAPTAGSPAGAAWTYKHGHWGWKVVWMLEDGTVLKTAYHYAQPDASWLSSNAPSTSRAPEGTCTYSFNGWNNTVNTDNQEVTVVADYSKTCTNYYTVTWKSEDGIAPLETDENVGTGESTRYNGAAPSKPFDTELSRLYTFDGWATEPNGEKVYDIDGTPAASGDAIYYAHFAVTEVVAIVKADDDTTYCTSIEEAFEVVRNTNFTPTIQVWKDASIPALVYNIENYCTLDLNGHTLTSVTSSVQSPFRINKNNITFTITDSSESQSGKLSMTSTYGSTIFGLFVDNGKLMLNGGTIEVISGTATTFGVTANSNGSFIMNGGTIHVVTTNNKEGRGVYSAGTVLINDGTVHVEAAGNAYAIRRDGGTVTVNGGKFNINGSSSYINYGTSADANIAIKGGYYTTNNRLATVVPSPYIVYDWASEDEPYKYMVAAKVAYAVTFQNTDGTPLQTGTWAEGTMPAYAGETPTKPGDTEGAWMLGGWTPDLASVTEDATYTAVYVPAPPVASVTISGTTTNYYRFANAWSAVNGASAASTLTLLQDVALTSMLTFTSSRNCTFDLNGYTISNTDLVMFNLSKTGITFTLTDGSEEKTGKVVIRSNGASTAYGVLVSKGTFVLHAGTIEAYLQANTSQGVRVANGASFTMEGGAIDVMTTNAKNGDGVFANTTGSATITGGTIRVRAAATGYAVNAVGAVTVTGGHFYAAGGTSTACVAGSPTLQGGYYNINTNLVDNTSASYYVFPNADETYLHRVAEGYTLTWFTDGELAGEGYTPSGLTVVGTPIVAPTSTKSGYVFAGWSPSVAATMPAANTTYTAQWAVASVTINGNTTLYTTFDAAWSAANSAPAASTIQLLQEVSITEQLTYNNSNTQNCTLDLNGNTLTSTTNSRYPLYINKADVTFTITDSGSSGMLLLNTTSTSTIFGVYADKGTIQLNEGTIEVRSGSANTCGVTANSAGTFTMNGGTIHVVTSNNKEGRGVYSAGTAIINDGTVHVEAAGNAYAIKRDGGTFTVNGGRFNITASSGTAAVATANRAVVRGGYYTINTDLAPCVSAPYHVFDLAGESPYLYKVAEGYTITFNNYDGTSLQSGVWEKGATPAYSGATPTKPADAQYTYTFDTWSPAISSVTANATYTATYSSTVNNYTVTIAKNEDVYGSISTTEIASVPYGSTITVEGNTFTVNGTTVTATPETSDAQYTYAFSGWTNAPGTVEGNMTITANFTRTTNTYTVLWKDEDGTILETDENVSYGFTPSFDGTTPTKTADEEYVYTFAGWTPDLSSVTGDVTYTATYNTTSVVASVTISGSTTYYTTFDAAWTAASGASSDATLTLLQDVTGLSASRTYSTAHNLTLDLNGHTISGTSSETYLFRINSTGYTFTVTDGSANKEGAILFSATVGASYCVNVTNGNFVMDAGKIYAESSSEDGVIGCVQSNGGTFTMNENGALHAKYTGSAKNGRAVHANGGTTTINGGTIRVESKTDGMGFVYVKGSVVTVNGGWFKITASGTAAVTNQNAGNAKLNIRGGYYSANNNAYLTPHVKTPYHIFPTADAEYPQKVAEGYTVTFNNYDGTSLQSGVWEKGATPAYSGATPTKPANEEYEYTFAGWSPAVDAITGNTEYTATYSTTPMVASVTISGATTYYTAFDAAWTVANSATAESTIKLLGNVTILSYAIYQNNDKQNCTLDLNGHTLSTAAATALYLNTANITFTVTDSSDGQTGKLVVNTAESGAAYGVLVSKGQFQLDAGTIEAHLQAANSFGVRVAANTYFIMNGGTIDVVTTNGKPGVGVYTHKNDQGVIGTAAINGGTIRVTAAATGYAVENKGTTTITDGYFYATGSSAACVYRSAGSTLALQGGYYNTDVNLATYVEDPYQVLPNEDETYLYKVAEVVQPEDIEVEAGQTVTINSNTSTSTTTVHVSGTLTVEDNVTLTTTDLILEATPSSSGEIIGEVAATNAYFDLSNGIGGFKARTWYAIAVPWEVNAEAGVSFNDNVKTLGQDFDLIYYDGARRAGGATKAWNYVEDETDKIMHPGRAYMIYLAADADVIRFKKSASAELHTDEVDVVKHSSDKGAIYADWNGIANPATYKAYLNVGTTENLGQVYNADTKQYSTIHLNSDQLQVGQPIFVQPIDAKTVVAERDIHPSAAPRRAKANVTPFTRYEVALTSADDEVADRIIVRMDEDKETDAYTVGQDLAKMGLSTVVPQMWVNRYNTQLCVNTVAGCDHTADYPLGIFAPNASEYTISIDQMTNEQSSITNSSMLYLTYDGQAIWNLSYGGYVASLNKGTDTHYGLRIVYAPQVTTGIEETTIQNGEAIRKVIVNDKVYIIRNGEMYSIDGKLAN